MGYKSIHENDLTHHPKGTLEPRTKKRIVKNTT